MASAGTIKVDITADTSRFRSEMIRAQRAVDQMARGMTYLGRATTWFDFQLRHRRWKASHLLYRRTPRWRVVKRWRRARALDLATAARADALTRIRGYGSL